MATKTRKFTWQISQRSNGIVISEVRATDATEAWDEFIERGASQGLNPDRCRFDVLRIDEDA